VKSEVVANCKQEGGKCITMVRNASYRYELHDWLSDS